jgi:hypothetical protein
MKMNTLPPKFWQCPTHLPFLCLQRGIAAGGMNAYEDSDLYVAPPEGLSKTAGEPASAEAADAAAGTEADPNAAIDLNVEAAEGAEQQVSAAAENEAATAVRRQRRRRLASHPAAPHHVRQRSSASSSLHWQTQRWQARRQRRWQLQRQQHHQQQQQQRRRLLQARQDAADAARREWDVRQRALREAVPWGLWNRSRAAWGSDLLPWWVTGTCHQDAQHPIQRCMAAGS